jgi:type II secretory pathway pseudopilin PulG
MRLLRPTHPRSQRGFSIVEMVVVFAIVTIAISMFARTMASSKKLDPVATETTMAASAARTILEQMKNHPFEQIFPLYNTVPGDDPGGVGTAPGAFFDVEGLTPIAPGVKCGTVVFPTRTGQFLDPDQEDGRNQPNEAAHRRPGPPGYRRTGGGAGEDQEREVGHVQVAGERATLQFVGGIAAECSGKVGVGFGGEREPGRPEG